MGTPPISSQTESAHCSDVPIELRLAIEYWRLPAVQTSKHNARTHSKRQIQQIAESIRAFGFVSPLVIDRNGELIAGHGRLAAAKLIGLDQVPVVCLDHLNEAQKRALRIADNKLAELAGWDQKLLKIELQYLLDLDLKLDLDFDTTITGFASADIDRIVTGEREGSADFDDALPEGVEQAPTVSRLGDLWQLGDHRLLCGDSRDEQSYQCLLGSDRAVMSISDAPYNVSVTRHVSKSGKHKEFAMGVGEMSEAAFTAFLAEFLRLSARYSQEGAIHWTFMDWRHAHEMLTAGKEVGLELKNIAVWNKGVGAMGSLLRSQHELVFMFKEPNGPHINNVELGKFGRNRTNVWDYPGAVGLRRELELHPTPKPVALVADAIRDVSNRNDLVLDVFSGSGTTIIAAAKTGRRARVIELDPHYVDVAVRRWQEWSGEPAVHLGSGLTFTQLGDQRRAASTSLVDTATAGEVGSVRIRARSRMAA